MDVKRLTMKTTLLVIVVLLVGGCATTSTKPVRELTADEPKVAGEYKIEYGNYTEILVFLDNGISESYINGKKRSEAKWKLTKEGELHITLSDGSIIVCRINKDGSTTEIAFISKDGKREDYPKEDQKTYKKIK